VKRGYLERYEDISGVSGTGKVAEIAISSDGRVAIFWPPPLDSIAGYSDIEKVKRIHGHNGKTAVVILDEEAEDHEHCLVCHSDVKYCTEHDNICIACMEQI
jgi:hypothetical protein